MESFFDSKNISESDNLLVGGGNNACKDSSLWRSLRNKRGENGESDENYLFGCFSEIKRRCKCESEW